MKEEVCPKQFLEIFNSLRNTARDLHILSDQPLYKKTQRKIGNLMLDQRIAFEENVRVNDFLVDFKVGETLVLISGNRNKNLEGGCYSELMIKKDFLSEDGRLVVIIDEDVWSAMGRDEQISFLWE